MNNQTYEPLPQTVLIESLRTQLQDLMVVEQMTLLSNEAMPMVEFGGHLVSGDADALFEEILQRFEVLGYTPMLSARDDLHILKALPFVPDQRTGKVWVNALLFGLTILSVLFIGAAQVDPDLISHPWQIWPGWPFAVALLGILTAHELSHYFMGRRYGSPLTLPYFIPMPISLLGTMGALIVQRAPMRSRKALFDIGIAGPIGGLLVAVPLLFFGLSYSEVGTVDKFMTINPQEEQSFQQEGNSLLYLGAKYIVHGKFLPNPDTGEDVWLAPPSRGGPVAFAAWGGLLVTMFNLLPIGQLDGGHVSYAIWGTKAWLIARIFLLAAFVWGAFLLVMGNLGGVTWIVWWALGQIIRPLHPPPLNDLTPLDSKRKALGWVMIVVFILILIPIPLVQATL